MAFSRWLFFSVATIVSYIKLILCDSLGWLLPCVSLASLFFFSLCLPGEERSAVFVLAECGEALNLPKRSQLK
jgi:hypothetical protein